MKTVELQVSKMKCEGCTAKVQEISLKLGAESAVAHLDSQSVTLLVDEAFDLANLADALTKAGYPARL